MKAYDEYLKTSITPFVESCKALDMKSTGESIQTIFQSLRFIIALAARSKKPSNVQQALVEHLKPTQEALKNLSKIQSKLPRDLDRHVKAIQEMNAVVSWVVAANFPAKIVKESIASAEFWTNRIQKDFKNDENQIAFCLSMKKTLTDLVTYIQEYHESGLAFTGTSMSLQEAALRLTDESTCETMIIPKSPKKNPVMGNVVTSGNIAGLMGELTKRQTADGSSAATGLKHVTKDQQTWRKEYASTKTSTIPAVPSLETTKAPTAKVHKKKPRGLPIFEYQDRGFKWLVENQTIESNKIITVEITDAKQQVYIYNCEGITVKIVGKFKSLAIDNCEKLNVVFDDLISSTEVVNCKKLQLQVTGVCPVFTIDKTINIVVYLSEASKSISSFCTSLSSEMNVSFPVDGTDDLKELPIPEQFVHTIAANGTVTSEVSDLYH